MIFHHNILHNVPNYLHINNAEIESAMCRTNNMAFSSGFSSNRFEINPMNLVDCKICYTHWIGWLGAFEPRNKRANVLIMLPSHSP